MDRHLHLPRGCCVLGRGVFDHPELYSIHNDEWIFICSPYGDEEQWDNVAEAHFMSPAGLRLYSDGTVTYQIKGSRALVNAWLKFFVLKELGQLRRGRHADDA